MPELKEKKEEAAHEEKEILEEDLDSTEDTPSEVEGIAELLELVEGDKTPKAEEEEVPEEGEESTEKEETEEPKDKEEEEPSEKEDETEEEKPKGEVPEEEGPKEEEPPKEEEESEEKEEEDEDLVSRLRGEIGELSKQLTGRQPPPPSPAPAVSAVEGEETPAPAPEETPVVEPLDISDEEYNDAMTDKGKFLELINKSAKVIVDQSLGGTVQALDGIVSERLAMNQRANDFFDEHEDLRAHRDYVGYLAEDLADKNQDWDADKVFKELSNVARERLGLTADTTTTKKGGNNSMKVKKTKIKRPAFAKGTQTKASVDTLSEDQKDIAKTLEL